MPVKKLAISLPPEVLEQVDRAAAARSTSRSAYIADVLRRVARARTDAEITRRINALFADPALAREQRDTAAAYKAARPRRGTEW